MRFDPEVAEKSAATTHLVLRRLDVEEPEAIHPLLFSRSDVTDLPSAAQLKRTFNDICGGGHQGHSSNAPESCFLHYSQFCDPGGYAKPPPGEEQIPISPACLPGGVPILEHLLALFKTQETVSGGSSFVRKMSGTLDLCNFHRQTGEVLPTVHTVIYGTSTLAELNEFMDLFNKRVAEFEAYKAEYIPNGLYSFDVEKVTRLYDAPFRLVDSVTGEVQRVIWEPRSLPARIHLGFYGERFDIVIPWEYKKMSRTFQADYSLRVPSQPLDDQWHALFGQLKGHGIGIGLSEDIKDLSTFLQTTYKFTTATGPISLRTLDLLVFLALAGYNSAKTNITGLNFMFTGGLVMKQWQIRCGFGRWGQATPLPPCLSLYLQSEVYGVLNTALLCLCCILVHWFPTPRIAAVCSRKHPSKFVGWFWRFILAITKGASIPVQALFHTTGDRVMDPKAMVRAIQFEPGTTPHFSAAEIADCIPPWRNVTAGGCPSDQLAIGHILANVWPLMKRKTTPLHLQWESAREVVDGFLTGLRSSSGGTKVTLQPGCTNDVATLDLPLCLPDTSNGTKLAPIRKEYVTYQASLPDGHALKRLSGAQLLLLFVWKYPEEAWDLYNRQAAGSVKYFSNRDYDLLQSVILAKDNYLAVVSQPEGYQRYCQARAIRNATARIECLKDRLKKAADEPSCLRIRKKLRKAKSQAARIPALPGEPSLLPRASNSWVPSPAPDWVGGEVQVVRRLPETPQIGEPDSPRMEVHDSEDEVEQLIIETADWDDL